MKIALVTGGNRGIGSEICRQLDELGYKVILGSRDIEKGKKSAEKISNRVTACQLDVTDEESIQRLFEFINNEFGSLDVLINNAGVGAKKDIDERTFFDDIKNKMETNFYGIWRMIQVFIPLLKKAGIKPHRKGATEVPLKGVKKIMNTNFLGAWRMIRSFVPLVKKSEGGRIINVSSGMGQFENLKGEYPGYSISKAALNALTVVFANELKGTGINVNAVCPGWVRTDMGGSNAPLSVSEGADTVVWLATEKKIPTGKFFRNRQIINW